MMSAIIVASIAIAVILGYKTKINTGLFCFAFAYIIGCFALGLKPKELIAFWPTSTMFVILSVSTERWRNFLPIFYMPVGSSPECSPSRCFS